MLHLRSDFYAHWWEHISCVREMANTEDPYAVACNRVCSSNPVHAPDIPTYHIDVLPG